MATSGPAQSESSAGPRRLNVVALDDERQVAYADYGSPDGAPVVFFHGTPGSHRLGALLESAAREHGVRVLALERPGYGRSTPWPDQSVSEAETFVSAVLDDATVREAGLVAFSGGAPYALATAAMRPDRVTRVDAISGATPPGLSDATPVLQRLLAGLARTAPTLLRGLFRGQAWAAERLDPSFVVAQYTTGDGADAVPDDVAEVVKADFLEAFARYRSGAVTEFRATATDWGFDVDDIDVDVGLWHGDRDTNVPLDDARRLQAALPTAELQVLDGADHLGALLRSVPEVLARHRRPPNK